MKPNDDVRSTTMPAGAGSAKTGLWRVARDPSREGVVLTTRVGLQIPTGLDFDAWEHAGRQLAGIVDSSAWWLGDWLVYGKDNYADRYERGIRAAGLKYQTLRNYAWVSRRFDLDRRRSQLSFQHHAEVASLPVEEQDRWLEIAARENLTTRQLRTAIQNERDADPNGSPRPAEVRQLAVPSNRVKAWRKAAELTGFELEKWVLEVLDRAAEYALEGGDPLVLVGDPGESGG